MIAAKKLARLRRGIPILQQKAAAAFAALFGQSKSDQLASLFGDRVKLETMPVHSARHFYWSGLRVAGRSGEPWSMT